ncbi:glycosyltransferase [Vibrio hibernica]|uniref:glycosyltransferase n=1 Tax=Vibrio hibernica TaxID=2587465 RepID=UPI00187EB1EE|nr:glycosyltransferase [Vibrio hibernica]
MDLPLVSIYITTHNRSSLLFRAVTSVLNQDYDNIEIIIADDGSIDDTETIVRYFMSKDSRVIYVRHEIPLGANSARNLAIDTASGVFITGLDDDDEFKSNRISTFIKNWNSDYSFLCGNFDNIYDDKVITEYNTRHNKVIKLKDLLFYNFASNQIFTLLSRLKEVRFSENVKKSQDWDCWIRMVYTHGPGFRLKSTTYKMFHDGYNRVSMSQEYKLSYYQLVERNELIYKMVLGDDFVNKYMLNYGNKNVLDIFHINSYFQLKFFIKSFLY